MISRDDQGGATVWALMVGLGLFLTAMAVVTVGAAMVARHRAGAAADLAALGGAGSAVEGEDAACARASAIATANGARLVECRVEGFDVVVGVVVTPAGPAALAGSAMAKARAGPVDGEAVQSDAPAGATRT